MLGSIALSVILVLLVTLFAFVHYRGRRAGRSWYLLREVSPVSAQWLADYRRSG